MKELASPESKKGPLEIVVQVILPSFALPSTYAKASCLAWKIASLFPGLLYSSLHHRMSVRFLKMIVQPWGGEELEERRTCQTLKESRA